MLEFIQSADWSILHWIQENLRCGALDALLPKLTLLGEAGAIWIAVAIGCCSPRDTGNTASA